MEKGIFVGIDIGNYRVKVVGVESDGKDIKIILKKQYKSIESLQNILETPYIKRGKIIINAGKGAGLIRTFSFRTSDIKEIKNTISGNLKDYFPPPKKGENFLIDAQIIESTPMGSIVLAGVGKENLVLEKTGRLLEMGLFPEIVDVDPLALALPFMKHPYLSSDLPVLLIDIGKESTSSLFIENGFPRFSTGLKMGGDTFTEKISMVMKVSHSVAEGIKRGKKGKTDKIKSAFQPIFRKFVKEIEKIKNFYGKEEPRKINCIFTGGGVLTPFLEDFLKEKFPYNFDIGKPMDLEPDFSYALGLALRGVYPDVISINILPEDIAESGKEEERKRVRKKRIILGLSIVLLPAVLLLIILGGISVYEKVLNKKIEHLNPVVNSVLREKKAFNEMRKRYGLFFNLRMKNGIWDRALYDISRFIPKGVWLHSIKTDVGIENNKKYTYLLLTGGTKDLDKITRFVSKLESSSILKAPKLENMENRGGNYIFTIRVRIEQKEVQPRF